MASMRISSFGVALALALGLVAAPESARATATWQFNVSGQLEQQSGCVDDSCSAPGEHIWPWTGQLTVVLDSNADGVYDASAMVSFDFVSTCCSFLEPSFTPIPFDPSFTVQDGKLIAIDASYYDPTFPIVVTSFDGLTVRYDQPLIYFTPETTGTATLTPVPESGTWAMLSCALVLAAAWRLAGTRHPASARSSRTA